MTGHRRVLRAGAMAVLALACAAATAGQQPRPTGTTPAGPARPRPQAAARPPSTPGTVNQLMRGLYFPASNVVFAGQTDDPATIPRDMRGSVSTDLLRSVFGGWEAVENSALAMAEATPLLLLPGRTCSNGRIAPVTDPDWKRYANETREAALVSAMAARAKDQDRLIEATDQLSTSCSNCHRAYREGTPGADQRARCAPKAFRPAPR
ncbi:MAG: hypothetical protein ABL971_13520 [Vicinamibacterales bacterium]